jgi:dihydropyrimidinase
VGADADIVLWNPERTQTLSVETQHSRADYNMHEGRTVTGWPTAVLVAGEPLVVDGELVAQPQRGFLARERAVPVGG